MSDSYVMLRKVKLKDYRSIAWCDVSLEPLTILVGKNGSGKSNFIDALRFVSDALSTSIDHAMLERGGIQNIRRKSNGHPNHFGIRLEVLLSSGRLGVYSFEVAAQKNGGFEISKEQCGISSQENLKIFDFWYEIQKGQLDSNFKGPMPKRKPNSLYLPFASALDFFGELYSQLSGMKFYSIQPERVRALQAPDQGLHLLKDGGNIASVIRRMGELNKDELRRVNQFLGAVVQDVEQVEAVNLGPMLGLEFRQRVEGAASAWRFPAQNMSDGTLRTLAILVALFQPSVRGGLVGMEEPETALHPAAAGVLLDALRSATRDTQVILTSHSPDLLDHPSLRPEEVLAVEATEGRTVIGPLAESSFKPMKEHLFTGGELLRLGQLVPAESEVKPKDRSIFDRWVEVVP